VFQVGSISEIFLGVALAELLDERRLSADTRVSDLLPDGVRLDRDITLLDLATHRSGLPPLPANFIEQDRQTTEPSYTAPMLYAALDRGAGEPGKFRYSYFGPGLLGHLLALHEHTTYRDLVHDRVLAPLGLEDTDYFGTSDQLRPRLADGHDPDGSVVPQRFDTPVLGACCAVRSSAADLLEIARSTLEASRTAAIGRALLRMKEPVSSYKPGERVGIGWHIRDSGLLFKRGGGRGFASHLLVDPTRDVAIVVLSGSETIDAEALTLQLGRALD
jgi:CubicO group peptidase (beta-lactamase class C family)